MERVWTLGLLALLAGAPTAATCPNAEVCDGVDNDSDGQIDEGYDEDGDGYLDAGSCLGEPGSLDCDDDDPGVNPGAVEGCDGVDDDCDGRVDEGVGDIDADGDGALCAADCDEGDPSTYPGAPEVCDGVDNDCDGGYDEDFDLDGDGIATCAGDCDDRRAEVYPGAQEVFGDALDNNCDGVSDATLLVRASGDNPEPGKPLYRTIQGAINAAINGEIIAVYGGMYWEAVDLKGKAVTLVGVEGPEVTVIDAGKTGSALLIQGGQAGRSVVVDLTLTGGKATEGGGIRIEGVSPTVRGCILERNAAERGGGLAVVGGASPRLEGVIFAHNTAELGGGIYLGAGAALTLTGGEVVENTAYALSGVETVMLTGSDGTAYEVAHLTYLGDGGGMYLAPGAAADLSGSRLRFNFATRGGGIFHEGVRLNLQDVELVGNEAGAPVEEVLGLEVPGIGEIQRREGTGGGIYGDGDITAADVLLRSNYAIIGGGLALVGGAVDAAGLTFSANQGYGLQTQTLSPEGAVRIYEGQGGAVALIGGDASLAGVSATGDRSLMGGAIFVDGGRLSLRGARIDGAAASGVTYEDTAAGLQSLGGLGGGVYLRGGESSLGSIIVQECWARQGGGGVYLADAGLGGLDVVLSNVSIVGGDAPLGGGVALDTGEGDVTLRNLIVAYSKGGGGIYGPIPEGALSYSDLFANVGGDLPGGEDLIGQGGNISASPRFLSYSADDDGSNDDLRLSPLSPARDAGDPAPELSDPDGSRGDMGAYGGPDADTVTAL